MECVKLKSRNFGIPRGSRKDRKWEYAKKYLIDSRTEITCMEIATKNMVY
jgi:hypothetical protein